MIKSENESASVKEREIRIEERYAAIGPEIVRTVDVDLDRRDDAHQSDAVVPEVAVQQATETTDAPDHLSIVDRLVTVAITRTAAARLVIDAVDQLALAQILVQVVAVAPAATLAAVTRIREHA